MRRDESKRLQLYTCDKSGLLWVRSSSTLFKALSLNVCREICEYLSRFPTLIGIQDAEIQLYCPLTGSKRSIPAPQLPSQCLYTLISTNSVLCLGGQPVTSQALILGIHRKKVIKLTIEMSEARFWPGVIQYGPVTYVFGGKDTASRAKVTSECFSASTSQWRPVPRMSFARVAFSPCLFANEIYLPEANSHRKPFEVFNPSTQLYSRLPIYIVEPRFLGSVACVVADSLCYISRSGKVGRWNVRDVQTKSLERCILEDTNMALSCCVPVVVGRLAYWVKMDTATIIQYNFDTNSLNALC